ncbi:MAG: hypothetical protein IJ253_09085, partial [Bacteroidaceae bacterium]|nr:hypothetical protein [Bacteroidaceae bacterium]
GGIGPNIQAMYEAVCHLDSTRLPFYDCHLRYSALHDFGYPYPDDLIRESEKEKEKPLIAREYAHAMGNSMGNLHEVQHVYQPITFVQEGNALKLINHDCFTALDEYDYTYALLQDGDSVEAGSLTLTGDRLVLPSVSQPTGNVLLNVSARLCTVTLWAPAAFPVAQTQLSLHTADAACNNVSVASTPKVKKQNGTVVVTTSNGTLTIDPTGALISWQMNGTELLAAPLEPYFWKPANDNQDAAHFAEQTAVWRDAADRRQVASLEVKKEKTAVKIVAAMRLPVGADYILTYTIRGEGTLQVDADYQPTAADIPLMPKFGMRLRLPADYTNIEYVGRGPWENYPDRKTSAFVGHYTMPLSAFQTEYVKPQDNGCRCDVNWLALSSDKSMLCITGLQPLCIRAWDYGEEDLEQARHPHEIVRGRFVNLNIDENLHGVGGADTWGKHTLPQYTLDGTKPRHYAFTLNIKQL